MWRLESTGRHKGFGGVPVRSWIWLQNKTAEGSDFNLNNDARKIVVGEAYHSLSSIRYDLKTTCDCIACPRTQ